MKLSKNWDEVCYPFIHQSSYLCDFEVTTDELCALIGSAIASIPDEMQDIRQDLEDLQPLAFHINGSIRGHLAVTEDDQQWLLTKLRHYRAEVGEREHVFVLPRGTAPVPQLHLARSAAKKAIRCMVRIEEEGKKEIPDVLPRMCNTLCNLFFLMTLAVNQRRGIEEIPFVSKSYGKTASSTD